VATAANATSQVITQLATVATSATGAVQDLSTAATQIGAVAQAIVNGVVASAANLGSFPPSTADISTIPGIPSILPATGKVSDSQQYAPGSYGYNDSSYGAPSVVNLTLNLGGSIVASDASAQMLATKIASSFTTLLRQSAGLKL